MEKNGLKRRLIARDSNDCPEQPRKLLVDTATNTESQTPMHLNAWTQTFTEDSLTESSSSVIDELQNRINKLEELFRSLNSNQRILPPIVSTEHVIPAEQIRHFKPPQPTKYKIFTSKGVEYVEPIEIVFEDDGTYNDHNTSNDSNRLEIFIPKDEEERQQEPHQEQQNGQHQQILYQAHIEHQQDQHQTDQKFYNNSTLHNTVVSTALQTPISTPVQQPSHYVPVSQLPMEIKPHGVKKEPTKTKKTYLGSTTNLNEITSSQEEEPVNVTNVVVSLGPHNTRIPAHIYETMDWSSPTAATRKLLITIFDRETLSTHTMTGKPSPAFKGRDMPIKHQLDPLVVADIIFVVSRKCGVPEKDVRNAITTKCADENKMSKQRELKRKSLAECNKENVKTVSIPATY